LTDVGLRIPTLAVSNGPASAHSAGAWRPRSFSSLVFEAAGKLVGQYAETARDLMWESRRRIAERAAA
jgi:hypothetical protein